MLDKVSMAKAVNSTELMLGKVFMLVPVDPETTAAELAAAKAFYIEREEEE